MAQAHSTQLYLYHDHAGRDDEAMSAMLFWQPMHHYVFSLGGLMQSFKDYYIDCMTQEEEPTEEEWLALIDLAEKEDDDDDWE